MSVGSKKTRSGKLKDTFPKLTIQKLMGTDC